MNQITTEVATIERWDDVQHALTGGGDGASCQCTWWTIPNAQFNASTRDERREILRDEITAGPPPGLIAYVDGKPAGWIRIGPRTNQIRLSRTRNIISSTAEPFDDPSVWAVTCFVIRREHHGKGVAHVLLNAGIEFARQRGARLIEAYPVDTSVGKHRANELFLGTVSMFIAAGFTERALRKPGRPLMALTLN